MSAPHHPPSGNGGKVAAGCGIGCLVTAIIVAVVIVGGALFAINYVKNLPKKFTSNEPIVVVSAEASPAEAEAVQSKFDAFRTALANGDEAQPFTLTTDEVNALISSHPDLEEINGKARVEFIDDKLQADVSVPLEGVNDLVDGRYFNGRATIKFKYLNGNATYDIESIEVNGNKLPKFVIDGFIDGLNEDDPLKTPEFNEMKKIIDEISINNGILKVVPKPASERGK